MRITELLNALARHDPGIEVYLDSKWATVTTLYKPSLRGLGKTLFEAAFEVAQQMTYYPDCPPDVKAALDAYDDHSNFLSL